MNLGESKARALSLMAEYSIDGTLIPDGENADYLNRMNRFADIAQKEISQVKKIHAVHTISQNPIKSQFGLLQGFDIEQHLSQDIIYQTVGSKSFYFEVDGVATVYLEENNAGAWQQLKKIDNTTKGKFTAYKGNVSLTSASNHVRIRFSGNYVYNIRNRALFEYTFPTDADVPNYKPYIPYQMPTDFMELNNVIHHQDNRQYRDMIDYKWEGKRTFVVNYYLKGSFDIHYYKYPTTIDQNTLDTHEFEVDTESSQLIPFFMAAHSIMDENQTLAIQLLNEYQVKLSRLFTPDEFSIKTITENYGM